MVRDVEADSPASRAGLKPFDILTLYDDQKLYSAEQLTRLVRADRPDANVSLNVVRAGATDKIQVTLGAVPATPEFGFPGPFGGMDMPMHRHHAPRYATPPGSDESGWETFDSMSIKKLKDGTFKADIQFLDKDGNLEKQEFTGTRKAIRSELLERKDIPAAERHQLLDALNARGRFMPPERWFGPRFFPPWFDWQPDF
jgi:membrane-associated protease RseP (regulator of RpoE activity)